MRDTDLQLTAPTPPDEVVTVAELHEVARHLTATGAHDYAAVIRKAINQRGFDTIDTDRRLAAVAVTLDEVTAEATVLAAHGPDVMVPARETGDRLLRVVGDR